MRRRRSFAARAPRAASSRSTSLPEDFHRPETTIWLFGNAHVVHYPGRGGEELAVVVVLDDRHEIGDWSAPVPPSWVQQKMPECAEPLQALILQARAWKQWALHTLPVPRQWTRGPIALLGDAAHPVLPFLAQGGVMALEDAVVIAEALRRHPDDIASRVQTVPAQAPAARPARRPRLAPQRTHLSPVGPAGGGAQPRAAPLAGPAPDGALRLALRLALRIGRDWRAQPASRARAMCMKLS